MIKESSTILWHKWAESPAYESLLLTWIYWLHYHPVLAQKIGWGHHNRNAGMVHSCCPGLHGVGGGGGMHRNWNTWHSTTQHCQVGSHFTQDHALGYTKHHKQPENLHAGDARPVSSACVGLPAFLTEASRSCLRSLLGSTSTTHWGRSSCSTREATGNSGSFLAFSPCGRPVVWHRGWIGLPCSIPACSACSPLSPAGWSGS